MPSPRQPGKQPNWRVAIFASAAVLHAAMPAMADRETPAPEAADQTLGMAILSATVDADGTLLHGSGVATVATATPGNYVITFGRNISDCDAVATAQTPGIAQLNGTDTKNTLFIQTQHESDISSSPRQFSTIVFCPR